ncbi:hypothetical protein RD110_08620 [Rhodoferax koreense]|uniref:Diguanylate cyclase n=1 Tax=Rhodoferax koreensis TaxID=1842727 RepID=A0A1P8JU81_9BURK|nr:GGDEF domain-containing phosphodiesterase [Rhodoferax koreense]APW37251.1 hypothetical protein RD110_08620 [Rhodoferax koreense]
MPYEKTSAVAVPQLPLENLGDVASMMLQAMQESPAPMMLTNATGDILRVNTAFEQATGYAFAELAGRNPSLLKSGLQGTGFYRSMWSQLRRTGRWQGEIWNRRKDGRLFQEHLSIIALRGTEGNPDYYLGTYAAQAPRGASRDRSRDGATDATTGLPSRQAFAGAADRLCGRHGVVHVLALDIDGFTELNELHGLESGDAVLRQMALRCTEVAAANGRAAVVARVGPDEFAIALAGCRTRGGEEIDAVQPFAARLYARMAMPFDLGSGQSLHVSVSVGLASLVRGCGTATEALLHASVARQQAVPGLPTLQRYEDQDGQRRMAIALREAVRLEQITLAYQPKVALATGRLAGVEALARWVLPDGTAVPPSEFIPLAERRGLIGALGDSVMDTALAQIRAWCDDGLPAPVVAVNFSALQFQRENPTQRLALAMDRHGVPAGLLELELTESLLIGDIDVVMQSLRTFRDLGVTLSIDDFGTGYSSLAYLRRFPIQYLKIDRQFVSAMASDTSACEIVRLIVEMAHRLNLRCIAEGIETVAQLELLKAMGCDEGQGFLLARPMPPLAMDEVLAGRLPWAHLFDGEAAATQPVRAGEAHGTVVERRSVSCATD